MRRGGDGDDVAMRTTMRSKLDVGEVEEEKTKRTDIYKTRLWRAGRVRACDVRVLDTTGSGLITSRISAQMEKL